jgi:hypothetical protein
VDPTGEAASVIVLAIAAGLTACLGAHFQYALWKYPNDEDMRHCVASCLASRNCGAWMTQAAGLGWELVTHAIRWDLGKPGLADALDDISSNADGKACAGVETHFQAVGPGICLITRWFRQSCDDCCTDKYR